MQIENAFRRFFNLKVRGGQRLRVMGCADLSDLVGRVGWMGQLGLDIPLGFPFTASM